MLSHDLHSASARFFPRMPWSLYTSYDCKIRCSAQLALRLRTALYTSSMSDSATRPSVTSERKSDILELMYVCPSNDCRARFTITSRVAARFLVMRSSSLRLPSCSPLTTAINHLACLTSSVHIFCPASMTRCKPSALNESVRCSARRSVSRAPSSRICDLIAW